jgi:hypothetical protein
MSGPWISSLTRLPGDHEHVLAWITGGSLHLGEDYMDIAMYLNGVFRVSAWDHDEPVPVSHWLPLPTAPAAREIEEFVALG